MAQINLRQRDAVLLGDDMGLGKTVQAITLFHYMKLAKILIVCPAPACGVWEGEIPVWSTSPIAVQTLSNGRVKLDPCARVVIVSYGLARRKPILKQLVSVEWDLMILDEAHRLANLDSLQTKACLSNLWPCAKYKLPMTGSVVRNQTIDLYPLFKRIAPDLFPGDRWEFARRFCVIEKDQWGVRIFGSKNADELNKLAKQFTIRRLKSKVAHQLPAKLEQKIIVPCPWIEQQRDEGAAADFSGEQIEKAIRKGRGDPEMAKLRAAIGLSKVPGIIDYFKELRNSQEHPEPFVLFCHHRRVWSELCTGLRDLGISVVGIHGGMTSNDERTQSWKAFQAGGIDCFLGTFAAAESITLTIARLLYYAEMSWSLDKNEQAADRVHRHGQKNQVQIGYFLADHPLDQVVYTSYKTKLRIKQRIVD